VMPDLERMPPDACVLYKRNGRGTYDTVICGPQSAPRYLRQGYFPAEEFEERVKKMSFVKDLAGRVQSNLDVFFTGVGIMFLLDVIF
jgi:hypothetical protein